MGAHRVGRDPAGEITQTDQRGITDHMTSCSVYQLERRRTFKVMVFVSPGES